jgi:hypothetical protein
MQSGFQSMIMLRNLGSTNVFLAIYAIVMSVLLSLKALDLLFTRAFNSNKVTKAAQWLEQKLIWNHMIRFVIQ